MRSTISARELRQDLARVVKQARQGQHFTVLYRSRVAFEIVPPGGGEMAISDLASDPVYQAAPVGKSADGGAARDHDREVYA